MNLSFLLSFVNIKDINTDIYDIRHFPFNSTVLSTNELNYLIWSNFSSLFNDKSFITMDDLVYTVGMDKDTLTGLFRLITSKDFIDYNNFSDFLNRVHNEDYLQLISNIPKDTLSTPSDWSSIGSDCESDDSIINIEENITIQVKETIQNPISPPPKQFTNTLHNQHTISNGCKSPKLLPTQVHTNKVLSPVLESPTSLSPLRARSPVKSPSRSPSRSPPASISTQPNPVKFYDPSAIPKPKPRSKPQSRYHFYNFEYTSNKQHSWYIECFLYVQHWFKTQKYIRVPSWVKKYF